MEYRFLIKEDGEVFLNLILSLDKETKFMMYEPGERLATSEMMCNRIEGMNESGSIIYGAFNKDKLLGFAMIIRGNAIRTQHSAYVVMGVLNSESGKGMGTKLLSLLDDWAEKNEVTRLELTVMTHNERAYELYLRNGYIKEGIKHNSMKIDGKYIDEYYMGKSFK